MSDRPVRKRPAHGVLLLPNKPTMIFDTVCTKNRSKWLADAEVHDTAAGDAVLRAAGGKVVTLDGAPFPYGPTSEAGAAAFRNPWFIAAGAMDLKT